jgi:hypothetical protein
MSGNTLTLAWNSQPGKRYHVERATDVTSPNWTPASEDLAATDTTLNWSTQLAPDDARAFFRIVRNAD